MKVYKSTSTRQKKSFPLMAANSSPIVIMKEIQTTSKLSEENCMSNFDESNITSGDGVNSSSSSSVDTLLNHDLSHENEESASDSNNHTNPCTGNVNEQSTIKSFKYLPHQLKPNNPSLYLQNILISRGYDFTLIDGLNSSYRQAPTRWQVSCYDHPILDALRSNNLKSLADLHDAGISMTACNPYCESVLHFAARKSKKEVVQYLLEHGSLCFVDDAGRLPMHDVCWRASPAFDIVALFLNYDIQMLQVQDRFGACPLDYVNPRQWNAWCKYLDSVKNKYWPVKDHQVTPTV